MERPSKKTAQMLSHKIPGRQDFAEAAKETSLRIPMDRNLPPARQSI